MTDETFVEMMLNAKGSNEELADLLRVSKSTIDRWKRGVSSPHPILHPAIEKLLNR